jgi:ribosomal protein S24E
MTAAELVKELQKPCKVFVQTQHTEDDTIIVQAVKADVIFMLKRQENPNVVVFASKTEHGDWIIN